MKFNEGVAAGRGFVVRQEPTSQRDYGLFVPHSYDPSRRYPVIVFLHGLFENGNDIQNVMRSGVGPVVVEKSKSLQFIVVFPQARKEWRSEGEVDYAYSVLQDVRKHYNVDNDRIVVTGLSTGGWGTWAMAEKYSSEFAAITPVCGFSKPDAVARLKRTPTWVFHNSIDPIVSHGDSQEMVDALKAAGNKQVFETTYDAVGHDAWTRAYRDPQLWTWWASVRRDAGTYTGAW
jgi:predicted peptidase